MIVYHGSDSSFRKLRVSKKLSKRVSTADNEGYGIYFSTNLDIAESYGKYLYVLDINKKYLIDFRDESVCRKYLNLIANYVYGETGINILNYFSIDMLAYYMYLGGISLFQLDREIYFYLDSNELWHRLPMCKIDKVYSCLKRFIKRNLKVYMFNYHIKNIGVIKDVSEDVVRIVDKRR